MERISYSLITAFIFIPTFGWVLELIRCCVFNIKIKKRIFYPFVFVLFFIFIYYLF